MIISRIGKIGRLPKPIRNELDRRIEDNQHGNEILEWLHSLPEVRDLTKKQFGGRAITPQNLSDWKQAGHLDWLRRQEAREAAFLLLQGADDLDEETTQAGVERSLSECFAKVFVVELTQAAMRLLEQERDVHKKWQAVCQINRELSRFRQGDQREREMALRQESLARAEAREQSEALERARTRDQEQQEAKAKATATAKETAEATNHPAVERPIGPISPIGPMSPISPPVGPVPAPGVPQGCVGEISSAKTPMNSQKSSLIVPNCVEENPTESKPSDQSYPSDPSDPLCTPTKSD